MTRPQACAKFCIFLVGVSMLAWVGCNNGAVRLTAGGATFPDPLIQKWSGVYYRQNGAEIDYSATGSGDGIRGVASGKFDFGCSDAPMTEKEIEAAKDKGEVFNVPVTMGAVAIVFNLPGVEKLVLSGPVLADIFLGDADAGADDLAARKPLKWNDRRIADLNPGVALPDQAVNPVGRSEASGTSNIFTEYLSKSSADFARKIGASKSPKWPAFVSLEPRSSGIAGRVSKDAFTIGYVEFNYAKKLTFCLMKNRKGRAIGPEAKAVTAAAEGVLQGPRPDKKPYSLHELAYSLTDVDADGAYPICGISYALLYQKQKADKGKTLVDFLKWATSEGQEFAVAEDYAPLPEEFTKRIHALLDRVVVE